ncbi:uncharacterized protein PADG_11098 [Paracoccidioides brasiliensis Pb18]|uniref:Uncharacterized protein n=1 Tax=Paracoccidioides brasiliensis (strain Pb18) TaxID=502780 RepID=A0A0A0HX47_PARBD|nr:uncharacterized protein PADG_11098 [Paracoccidioides brasiliensis Pb18]KGM92646.1 hypothetical protein PADG_11098 [Paracoccidioides brasiliensis Pb18]
MNDDEIHRRQDRQIERLIQRLEENSDFLSNTTKNSIKNKVDKFHKDVKIKLKEKHVVILTEVNYLKWKSSILADLATHVTITTTHLNSSAVNALTE